jgi:methylamine methyltransferase corrinoid protein reductive activase
LSLGIALDIGTSGFRCYLLDINSASVLKAAVTPRHPLPGSNVIDHLEFAVNEGVDLAQHLMVSSINRLISGLQCDVRKITRLAICGNPIQLSIFQGIEIRDLAYAGRTKLKSLGINAPCRQSKIIKARKIDGLNLSPDTEIMIPPSVEHEVGGDAIAMVIQTGILHREEIALATDYGTNAEMVLKVGETIFTGSTAAGPAIEGQQLSSGMLALPGAIVDVEIDSDSTLKTWVLDESMSVSIGSKVNLISGKTLSEGTVSSIGITGTGVIALIEQGIRRGIITLPKINTLDKCIKLPGENRFTEIDLIQVGKAVAAFRAGHTSLVKMANIEISQIDAVYLCGASGTFVDAEKARNVGLYPQQIQTVHQVGNTSLSMARDLILQPDRLQEMQDIANTLKSNHCMFASSGIFSKAFIVELSYWTEGMPDELYLKYSKRYNLPCALECALKPKITHVEKDKTKNYEDCNISIIQYESSYAEIDFKGCTWCMECINNCPEHALSIHGNDEKKTIRLDFSLCRGYSCKKCEKICPDNIFLYTDILKAHRK